jgi:hypothetical protein
MSLPPLRFNSLRIWTSDDGRIRYYRNRKQWYIYLGDGAQAQDKQLFEQHQLSSKSWRSLDEAYQGVAAYYHHSPPARKLRFLGVDQIQGSRYIVRKREPGWKVFDSITSSSPKGEAFLSIFADVIFPTRCAAGEAVLEWEAHYHLEHAS